MEGSFKALLVTTENGAQAVVRTPCPNVTPAVYGTASEVAVIEIGIEGLSLVRSSHPAQCGNSGASAFLLGALYTRTASKR
jgi:hypothetical protein